MRFQKSAVLLSFAVAASNLLSADDPWASLAKMPVPEGAKVSIEIERPEYCLSQNVLIRFVLENTGSQPFNANFCGDADSGRPERFKITATDDAGHPVDDPSPTPIISPGLTADVTLKPGEKFTQTFALLRWCQFTKPGRYTIQVAHDFGWIEGERKRPIGQATVSFRLPSAEEAERLIAKSEAERYSPNFVDYTRVQDPVYLNLFLNRVKKGEVDAIHVVGQMFTPDAIATLIELAGNPDTQVSHTAAQTLLQRLPNLQFDFFTEERIKKLRAQSWNNAFAPQVRALALKLLQQNNSISIVNGAHMIAQVGTPEDAPATVAALDRALAPVVSPRINAHDNVLDPPQTVSTLIIAMRELHKRGFELGQGLSGNAQLLLFFDWLADKPEPRPKTWLQSAEAFGPSNCYPLSEAVLRSIPVPVPVYCFPLIQQCMDRPDLGVKRLACELAGKSGDRSFLKPMLEIVASTHERWLLQSASEAAHKLGGRYDLYEIWANRIPEDGMMQHALDSLQNLIENLPGTSGGSHSPRVSPLELSKLWKQFLSEHANEIRKGKTFKIGDPALKTELFSGWREFIFRDGKVWPERKQQTAIKAYSPPVASAAQLALFRDIPPKPGSEINDAFRRYMNKLPREQSLDFSGGGIGYECEHHGSVCYGHLSSLGSRLPVQKDIDLVDIIPWCRCSDSCLRFIALDRLASENGYKKQRNGLSVPSIYDPEDCSYYENLLKTKAYLDQKGVHYDPKVFSDILMTVSEKEFANLTQGKWEEEVNKENTNFYDVLQIDESLIRVTTIHTKFDPKWPDRTTTTKFKEVRVTDLRQFALIGEWDQSLDANGNPEGKHQPSQYKYALWFVTKDVMWLQSHERSGWKKFRRVPPSNKP